MKLPVNPNSAARHGNALSFPRIRKFRGAVGLVLWLATGAFLVPGCGKNATEIGAAVKAKPTDSLVKVDTVKPIDTLRVATLNMSIGFPVSQLLFTDMTDTLVAYNALDTLYTRYKRGLPTERLKSMARTIIQLNLDIIGLQEVERLARNGVLDNDFLSELVADISAAGGPTYQRYGNILNDTILRGKSGTDTVNIAFREGDALLVKPGFQILDSARILYFKLLPIPVAGAKKTERAINYLRVKSPKGVVWQIYNTHLEVFDAFSSPEASELSQWVDSLGKGENPQVVIGDFNPEKEGQGPYTVMLEKGFRDTYIGAGLDGGYSCCVANSALWDTTTSTFSNRRLDFIFAKKISGVLESRTALDTPARVNDSTQVWATDHRMVWARLIGQ